MLYLPKPNNLVKDYTGALLGYALGKSMSEEENPTLGMQPPFVDFLFADKEIETFLVIADILEMTRDDFLWTETLENLYHLLSPYIKGASTFLPFYFIPFAHKYELHEAYRYVSCLVKRFTDDEVLIRQSIWVVSAIAWVRYDGRELAQYMHRTFGVDCMAETDDEVLTAFRIATYMQWKTVSSTFYDFGKLYKSSGNRVLIGAIVGALLDVGIRKNPIGSDCYRSFVEEREKLLVAEEPLFDKPSQNFYCSKYGHFHGYLSVDGFYHWKLKSSSRIYIECEGLIGDIDGPFEQEFEYWEWIQNHFYSVEKIID